MSNSDKSPAPVDTAPAAPGQSFAQKIQDWVKGVGKPKHPLSEPLIDDVKARVAERDAVVQKLQEMEKEFRQAQAEHAHLSGRIDGLVESVHRLETHAAD